ncbi:MAG: hypothetical protein AAFR11_13920 [Pseudomonadota bacterium]
MGDTQVIIKGVGRASGFEFEDAAADGTVPVEIRYTLSDYYRPESVADFYYIKRVEAAFGATFLYVHETPEFDPPDINAVSGEPGARANVETRTYGAEFDPDQYPDRTGFNFNLSIGVVSEFPSGRASMETSNIQIIDADGPSFSLLDDPVTGLKEVVFPPDGRDFGGGYFQYGSYQDGTDARAESPYLSFTATAVEVLQPSRTGEPAPDQSDEAAAPSFLPLILLIILILLTILFQLRRR